MYGANGACLRLHFDYPGNIAPDVFQPIAGPGVSLFRHR